VSARVGTSAGAAAGRLLALLVVLLSAAFPVRLFLLSPDVRFDVKLAWLALVLVGALLPRAGTLLLLAVPLVPIWAVTIDGVPLGIIHLLVLSQALPWLARLTVGRDRLVADPVALWLGGFVAAGTVSLLVGLAVLAQGFYAAGEFLRAVHEILADYLFVPPGPGLVNMLLALSAIADGALAYLLIRRLPPAWWPRLVQGVAAVAVAVAVVGVVQARTRWGLQELWLYVDPSIVRINSTFADPNALAAYFVLALPVVVALGAAASVPRVRALWLAGALLCGVALLQTAGRMGYLGAFIAMAVLFGGAARLGLHRHDPLPVVRRHFRRAVVASGMAAIVLLSALTVIGTARNVRHVDQYSYVNTLLYTANLRLPLDERLKGRLAIWRTVALMVADRPAFGTGIGTIFTNFPRYSQRTEAFDGTLRLSAHNTFLNVAAELGLAGLVIWLGLLAAILATAFRRLPSGDREVGWLRLGLAAGIVGYVVTMVSGDRIILREDVVVLMVVAALASAAAPAGRGRTAGRLAVAAMVVIAASLPVRAQMERDRVPLHRVSWGFHMPEAIDGVPFRWTTRHAIFHVPADQATLAFSLRSLAPFPQTVDITFDGRPADRLRLADHNWHDQRYLLPRGGRDRRFYRIELQVSPVWQPRHEDRELGVMVGVVN
jgi:hypothetical protein